MEASSEEEEEEEEETASSIHPNRQTLGQNQDGDGRNLLSEGSKMRARMVKRAPLVLFRNTWRWLGPVKVGCLVPGGGDGVVVVVVVVVVLFVVVVVVVVVHRTNENDCCDCVCT